MPKSSRQLQPVVAITTNLLEPLSSNNTRQLSAKAVVLWKRHDA